MTPPGSEHKKANEKRAIAYAFKEKSKDAMVFEVAYSERGRITKVDDILRTLRRLGVTVKEDTLERAFRVFEKQSEVDYFINKDAKAFLEEQFKLWLYQYVFSGVSEWTETRIKQLQTLRDIAFKIIAFISQFENELVKIWNKPKFVLNSHYVITLDRIGEKDIAVVEKLLTHKNFRAQIEEWRQLGIVDDSFKKTAVLEKDFTGKYIAKPYLYLPVDTAHFKDVELEILGLFDNFDQELDGWLIKSENYQAINTILPKFRERMQTIYIDPPYNTKGSEIQYVNAYKHSSWLSLLENRLFVARHLLAQEGVLCVAIDDSEYYRLYGLLVEQFGGEDAILGTIAVRSNPSGRSTVKGVSIAHDYSVLVAKTEAASVRRLARTEKQIARYKESDPKSAFEWVNFRKHGGAAANRAARPRLFYPIYVSQDAAIRIPKMEWNAARQEWKSLENPKPTEAVVYPINEKGEEKNGGNGATIASSRTFPTSVQNQTRRATWAFT